MTDFVPTIAAALLDCLCTNVAGMSLPPQHCCYRVGLEVAHDAGPNVDLCCEGLAYVALGDTFPVSTGFEADITRQSTAPCAPPMWGQKFRVGIVRCVPVFDPETMADPPTCADWNAAAAINWEDSWALRRTACCFRTWMRAQTGALLGMTLMIEGQTQSSPQGGCVERYISVGMTFPNCDC